jgi:acetyltransferase-like isoleucine patch superfamily enzyme
MSDLRRLPWRLRYEYAAHAASTARRLGIVATHGHTDVSFGADCRLGPRFTLQIPGPARLAIGNGCEFRRDFIGELAPGADVQFGDGVIFTAAALVQISTTLSVGTRAVFGQSVMIADGNHKYRDYTKHLLDQGYDFRPITIGDNAIVTSKCTILNSIGESALIGAGSVVVNPIPAFCLAVGSPARVVSYFGPPDQRPPDLDPSVKSVGEVS